MIDSSQIKKDFPIFTHKPELVYLDSTATSLKPLAVLDKENEYYTKYSANIYRGIYKLSEKATFEYEKAREKIAQFIGAKDPKEIVFVRNATEAINLVSETWGEANISTGDIVVSSIMEHHANFVPWQQLSSRKKANFRVVGIGPTGELLQEDLLQTVHKQTKLVALTHVSNVLSTINPLQELIRAIKRTNPHCLVLVDGAQAVPHMAVDVGDLGCDFYVFSSHKMLGPTGVGVLWGRFNLLHVMSPYQYGGEMIRAVYEDHSEFKDTPHKFEAGTPHIAGVIGLGAAVEYLEKIGMEKIRQHEVDIVAYALKKLNSVKGIRIYGPQKASERGGIIAFTMEKVHAHDIAQILDSDNICIRSGHHCAMPLHNRLDINSTARASFYIYTSKEDIDKLITGLERVQKIFS